ncbi:XkdX family protein (plasmid) [Fructilactobacillus ixorae]|uniref:XkdX family protein n=1 Tax=Fructilactobacillus ixorae TaxID=1750535 RepID=A0ABY5C6G0_9LACO|nr:XkdX family protein [Fructilactobacillus ixorae]USS94016.1 XkdX family protein [Fructilactobacillus ixorae]
MVTHADWVKQIKWLYDENLYSKHEVAKVVQYEYINQDDFKTITGEDYNEFEKDDKDDQA